MLRPLGGSPQAPPAEKRVRRAIAVVALALVAVATAQGTTPTVTAAVEPADPLFGDAFAYVVEATVDADRADEVRVVDEIGPFTRVAPTRESRSVANGVARVRVTETLACLTARCLPGAAGKVVGLPQAKVRGAGAVTVAPPAQVHVRSRVTGAAIDASKPVFRRPVDLPPATVRVGPALAQAGLALAGIVLLAVGFLIVVAPLHRRRTGARVEGGTDALARAVRLLRESTTRDSTDRRRAAGLAARIAGEPRLAVDAAQVAWSRAEPRPPDASTLADRMERTAERATPGDA